MGDMRNRAADVERLTRWVRDHGPAVKGYISSFVRDPASVDDLFQEVFCRAWEARGRYFESGKDRSYLLTIADRLCRDRGRRPAKEIQIGEDVWRKVEPLDRAPDAPAYVDVEAQAQLRRALSGLSESQRRTLLLRYWGDCDFSQIAGILEVPLGTALSHGRRGLLALQRILAGVIEK